MTESEYTVHGEVQLFPQEGGWHYVPIPEWISAELSWLADRGVIAVRATVGGGTERMGYLLKDRVADVGQFLDTLKNVADGAATIDPEVVAQLVRRRRSETALDRLTSRELDVLGPMAEGRSNAAISSELGVSLGAIEKHINSLFGKLDLLPAADDHRRVLAVLTFLGQ